MFRYKLPLLVFILLITALQASSPPSYPIHEFDPAKKEPWVESTLKSMNLEEKIAQLIFVRANLNGDYLEEVDSLVSRTGVGGIVWFKGNPAEIARHTQRLQDSSKIPLMVCMDAEYGVGMRLDSAWSFPRAMILGAVQDLELIRKIGYETGKQCKALGIDMNFAPVVDINSNPDNPVINTRSFGENVEEVSLRGQAFAQGLRDAGVLATAKHFPGHGDTDKDSHKTLPVINHSRDTIRHIDTEPFRKLADAGVAAIMTAHLQVPAIEPDSTLPLTLSHKGVYQLLRKDMKYKGLIITDALEMKGVTDYYPAGTLEVMALQAGNDVLLMPLDVRRAIDSIKAAVDDGRLSEKLIHNACQRVLSAKRSAGIKGPLPWKDTDWDKELNSYESRDLNRMVLEEAMTLVKNNGNDIPFKASKRGTYASLALNTSRPTDFQKTLEIYAPFDHFNLPSNPESWQTDGIYESLGTYETVFLSIHGLSRWPQCKYGVTDQLKEIVQKIAEEHKVILTVFGNPYAVNLLGALDNIESLVVAYEDSQDAQRAAAQALAGAKHFRGKLPVSINRYPAGTGIQTSALGLLSYCNHPAELTRPGLERAIDSIVHAGISAKAYPSCQVLAAKGGEIIYHKAFGYQTYDSIMPVSTSDIYDLASLTKIAATTLAIMKLYEQEKLDIDGTLGEYLPELKGSNKENLVIREVLAHQAGLKPWIPFYEKLLKDMDNGQEVFTSIPDDMHQVIVSQGIYMHKRYLDTLWNDIIASKLLRSKKYKYSDLGYYYMKEIIERITGQALNDYVGETFYAPLGLGHTAFKPAEIFCLNNIVPAENDTLFRHTILKGDVHDPGAAMLGGVAGHAGLFSNASDLAVIMQMLVNGGIYRGKRYLQNSTINEFTRQQFPLNDNRRGLGFDKPDPEDRNNGPGAPSASLNSFGHSGFTGTYVWADAESDIVYVFLSNRTWPHAGENKLARMNIRTDILEAVYRHLR